MKVLNLTLKKQWFGMIASGEKKEEYREIKPYWIRRLTWHEYHNWNAEDLIKAYEACPNDICKSKFFDLISANNGYQKNCPNIKWKHNGIRIGEGKPEWGAEPGKQYFILEIGDIIA